MTMVLTDVFTTALVTQALIVEETEVEYGSGQEIEELDGGTKEIIGRQEEWAGGLKGEDDDEDH
jgi:hypothetical protein